MGNATGDTPQRHHRQTHVNRDVYAMLLSELFQASGDAYAFPHAFACPPRGGTPGCWWHLLPTAAGLADSDRLVRQAVRSVFTLKAKRKHSRWRAAKAFGCYTRAACQWGRARAGQGSALSLTPCAPPGMR